MFPEMMALFVRVVNVGVTNALNIVQQLGVVDQCLTQVHPILPLPARDDIVDRCRGVTMMIEMTMFHHRQP